MGAALLSLLPAMSLAQVEIVSGRSPVSQWKRQPSSADILKAYPKGALEEHKSGAVTLRCVLTVQWAFRDCRVVEETPQGYGFAAAAVSLSPLYQMRVRAGTRPPPTSATMVFTVPFVCDGCPPLPKI